MSRAKKVAGGGHGARWRAVVSAAAILAGSGAHATAYNETSMGDLSNIAGNPTTIGALTSGQNHIVGSTIPSGPVVDPVGDRAVQDNDYVTFTVPIGYALTAIDSILTQPMPPILGTPNLPGDRAFVGIAQGVGVFLTGLNGPATGLLGWTLPDVTATANVHDILPDLGLSAPPNFPDSMFGGATGFSGPLGPGSYTLWILDGDSPALYDFDLVVAAVPEPSTWMMFAMGVGLLCVVRRRRPSGGFAGHGFDRSIAAC